MTDASEHAPPVIALDFGARRIGVAISLPLGIGARPLMVIERVNDVQAAEQVAAVMVRQGATACVIGLPLNMDGTEGAQAQRIRSFAGRLRRLRPDLSLRFQDERLSSEVADAMMDEQLIPHSRRPALRDQFAAVAILQSYLEQRKGDSAFPPAGS